jgi:hypothetical protein
MSGDFPSAARRQICKFVRRLLSSWLDEFRRSSPGDPGSTRLIADEEIRPVGRKLSARARARARAQSAIGHRSSTVLSPSLFPRSNMRCTSETITRRSVRQAADRFVLRALAGARSRFRGVRDKLSVALDTIPRRISARSVTRDKSARLA